MSNTLNAPSTPKAPQIATFYNHIRDISAQKHISVPEALQEARRMGITQLELFVSDAVAGDSITGDTITGDAIARDEVTSDSRGPEALAAQLAAAGMSVASMPVWFDFGRDGDVQAQAEPAFRAAKAMGAQRLLIIPGFLSGTIEEREAQRVRMLACTAQLGELADKAGVSLCMEDFDSPDAPYATSAGMLDFIAACPGLSACYDTGNFRVAAEDELSAYQALRGHIAHVHLKDRALEPEYGQDAVTSADGTVLYPCPVGRGEIGIAQALELLRADGYRGAYTIEHFGAADMLSCLQMSTCWVKANITG